MILNKFSKKTKILIWIYAFFACLLIYTVGYQLISGYLESSASTIGADVSGTIYFKDTRCNKGYVNYRVNLTSEGSKTLDYLEWDPETGQRIHVPSSVSVDSTGSFHVKLPPGQYILCADSDCPNSYMGDGCANTYPCVHVNIQSFSDHKSNIRLGVDDGSGQVRVVAVNKCTKNSISGATVKYRHYSSGKIISKVTNSSGYINVGIWPISTFSIYSVSKDGYKTGYQAQRNVKACIRNGLGVFLMPKGYSDCREYNQIINSRRRRR